MSRWQQLGFHSRTVLVATSVIRCSSSQHPDWIQFDSQDSDWILLFQQEISQWMNQTSPKRLELIESGWAPPEGHRYGILPFGFFLESLRSLSQATLDFC